MAGFRGRAALPAHWLVLDADQLELAPGTFVGVKDAGSDAAVYLNPTEGDAAVSGTSADNAHAWAATVNNDRFTLYSADNDTHRNDFVVVVSQGAHDQTLWLRAKDGTMLFQVVDTGVVKSIGFFGAPAQPQQATPITLADVIALLQAYGLAA